MKASYSGALSYLAQNPVPKTCRAQPGYIIDLLSEIFGYPPDTIARDLEAMQRISGKEPNAK